jgi:short subunit dehydrogenase-like uncharacterized protein
MPGRIVLLGATGYTGRLVASSLIEIGEKPVLAGRYSDRLRALSDDLGGLETAVADATDPQSVKKLVDEGDVLISTVGPFTLYGDAALEAALDAKAHYLDSTGEPAFIRSVFSEAGPRAERNGTTLLTAFGVDWVPGNVAAAAAAQSAGGAVSRIDIGYLLSATGTAGRSTERTPPISTGTRASLVAAGASPQHAWRGGRLVLEPAAKNLESFRVSGKTRWASSVGGSEALALPRVLPGLREVNVYMEWPGPPRAMRNAVFGISTALGALGGLGPGRRLIDGAVRAASKRTGGGPSEDSRSKSGTLVVAVCRGEHGGPVSAARLSGPVNGYTLTGQLLAWGAASLRAGRQRASGAVGPVEAFGLDECLEALSKAGLVLDNPDASDR